MPSPNTQAVSIGEDGSPLSQVQGTNTKGKSANRTAKPHTKAQAKAKAQDGAKTVGAPKKDPYTRAQTMAQGFSEAEPSNEYWFGDGHKNWIRTCKRVHSEIDVLGKSEEDATAKAKMQLAYKALGIAMRMAEAVKLHGLSSLQTLQTYEVLTRECQCVPKMKPPFPNFLTRQMHDTTSQQAWPPRTFWQSVKLSVLVAIFGDTIVPAEKQSALVTDKITASSQLESMTSCADVILALFDVQELDALPADELNATVRTHCLDLRVIAACETFPVKESKRVLQDALNSSMDHEFGQALCTFRSGREVVARAKQMQESLATAEEQLVEVHAIMTRLIRSKEQLDAIFSNPPDDVDQYFAMVGTQLVLLRNHMSSISDLCMKDSNHTN